MSRRKQMKSQQLHIEAEEESPSNVQNGEVTPTVKTDSQSITHSTPTPTTTPASTPSSATPVSASPKFDLRDRKKKMSYSYDTSPNDSLKTPPTSASFQDSAFQVNSTDITPPPRKKSRQLSPPYERSEQLSDYSRSRSAIATALVLAAEASPRRQSTRLQSAVSPSRAPGEGSGKRVSHRTCEYCGVIKPTPAALQRHLRKHTGERPFVCQVCHKAYKAKRSLMCHQLSHHPELGTDMVNGNKLDSSGNVVTPKTARFKDNRALKRIPPGACSPLVPRGAKTVAAHLNNRAVRGAEAKTPTNHHITFSPSTSGSGSKILRSPEGTQDFSVNVSNMEMEGGEGEGEELIRKSCCPHCYKEFVKPSDLKRHLMVHTGEKPYVCQFCQKGFKQPQSLNYHLKATHKVDITLSQGLEERFLRLKTRAAMRDLAAIENWGSRPDRGGASGHYSSDFSSSYGDPRSQDGDSTSHHQLLASIPKPRAPCSSFSPDFKHGLARQTSIASEGSWTEDKALGSNIVEVEIPQFSPIDGLFLEEVASPVRKVPMSVKKETMLFTQLDGVCSITKQNMQVFRCCLCDKISASLVHAFSHVSSHFEQDSVGLECRPCNMAFTSQPEMDEHYLSKHNVNLSEVNLEDNYSYNAERASTHYSQKRFNHIDDLNNNHDDLMDKQHAATRTTATSPDRSSSPISQIINEFSDILEANGTLQLPLSKGPHRCPKCNKCYMTKFLLDRHVAFHSRQELIENAIKSGAKINGAHRALLMQPPPVLLPDGNRYHQLRELDLILKAQQDDTEHNPESSAIRSQDSQEVLDAKAQLKQEGIEEEVTVVMPSEPDADEGNVSLEDDMKVEEEDCDSEIRSAPKRQLIPLKKPVASSSSKSRRKCTLPAKFKAVKKDTSDDISLKKDADVDKLVDDDAKLVENGSNEETLIENDRNGERVVEKDTKDDKLVDKDDKLIDKDSSDDQSIEKDIDDVSVTQDSSAASDSQPPPQLDSQPQPEPKPESKQPPEQEQEQPPQLQQEQPPQLQQEQPPQSISDSDPPSSPQEPQPEPHCDQTPQQDQEASASSQADPEDLPNNSHSHSNSPERESEQLNSPTESEKASQESHNEACQTAESGFLQNIHSAFGNISPAVLSSLYSGNGLLPPSSLATAAAGYLRQFPPLPGLSPFSLHASASVCDPSVSRPRPHSPQSPGNEEDQAEDLSLSSGSLSSPVASSSAPRLSAGGWAGQPDTMVGFPPVVWDLPAWSKLADRPSSPLSVSSSPANGKHMNPVWHSFSTDDLTNGASTDGRKVTSLSRTHSRLYVVNQPVDRERLCKPTVLPDGRTVYRCIFCHKDFLSYSDINRHMDFHEDIRPYKCNFCDYFARTNSQLKVHMMRHQGIREYCCRLCKYKGVTQSDLNRHMKSQIHLLKSQNECTKCGEGFVTHKTLEKHQTSGCKGRKRKDKDKQKDKEKDTEKEKDVETAK